MKNLKLFLLIHIPMQIIWTSAIVLLGSAFSGFSDRYIEMIIPFIFIGAPFQVLPISLFTFLVIYFLKANLSVSIKKKT